MMSATPIDFKITTSPVKVRPAVPPLRAEMAERIVTLRKHMGLSQADIAAKMGLTDATVSMWELARTEPNLEKIAALAKILRTSPEYLAFGVTYNG